MKLLMVNERNDVCVSGRGTDGSFVWEMIYWGYESVSRLITCFIYLGSTWNIKSELTTEKFERWIINW